VSGSPYAGTGIEPVASDLQIPGSTVELGQIGSINPLVRRPLPHTGPLCARVSGPSCRQAGPGRHHCRTSNRLRHVVLRIEVFGPLLITQLEESRVCQCAAARSIATSAGASASSWPRRHQLLDRLRGPRERAPVRVAFRLIRDDQGRRGSRCRNRSWRQRAKKVERPRGNGYVAARGGPNCHSEVR
jgi:hypothetical protein